MIVSGVQALLNVSRASVTFLCIDDCMCERYFSRRTDESHGPRTRIDLSYSTLWRFIWEVKENYFSMLLDIFSFHKQLYLIILCVIEIYI